MNKRLVSLVIPAYNEEENVDKLFREIVRSMDKSYSYEILFVDDGSRDHTLEKIKSLRKKDRRVSYVSFTRNFGHQSALRAGLDFAKGDCVVLMDADLQHPPSMLPVMLEGWKDGYDIVDTKRLDDNKTASLWKRITAWGFYSMMRLLSDTKLEYGIADFRLLDRKVVDELKSFGESTFFLRGLVSWVGFERLVIPYKPRKRYAGKTKYSLKKMAAFAIDAITSFSLLPLRIAIFVGFFMSLLSGIYGIYAFYVWLFNNQVVAGWFSVLISVLFIGGIQLVILGIIGEYIGKIFIETKKRPKYILRDTNLKRK